MTASERVYAELKQRLFSGVYRLRERLDVATLATDLSVSSTPVREALVRLASERLVTTRPSRGFFVRLWSEAELRALYEWRCLLLLNASPHRPPQTRARSDYPALVAEVFSMLAGDANEELRRAAANADDRLYAARVAEAEVFGDLDDEWTGFLAVLAHGSESKRRRAINRYHDRRINKVRAIRERVVVRAIGANGG